MANNQRKMTRRMTPTTDGMHDAHAPRGVRTSKSLSATRRAAKKQITNRENRAWRADAADDPRAEKP